MIAGRANHGAGPIYRRRPTHPVLPTHGSHPPSTPTTPACQVIGVRPEVGLAKAAGLELGPRGGIQVDEQMRTSDPHIFAVGDAVEVKVRGATCLSWR